MPKPDAFPPRWWRYEPGHGIAAAGVFAALTVAAVTEDGPWWKAALYGLGWALSAGLLGAWVSRATMGRRDPVAEVLRVLLATPGPHHGYSLMRTTYLSSGRVYLALAKLEEAGLVASEWGDRVSPGGPRRRDYTVPDSQRGRAQALLATPEPRNWRALLAEDTRA